jgi:hypothetical protein
MKRAAIGIFGILLMIFLSGNAMARSTALGTFNGLYGTDNTVLDACETCHGSSKSIRNPYGQQVEANRNAGDAWVVAIKNAEPYDSDGDGYFNFQEIAALTKPGDASDYPGGTSCTDFDGDTFATEGGICGEIDCNDADPNVNPLATEDCTDGVDNDCDGLIDTADPDAFGCPADCTDTDGDAYATEGGSCGAIDCDDNDAFINPGMVEDCSDGFDNDCDDLLDCADPDCGTDPACGPVCEPVKEICDDGIDNDCDATVDCDDKNCRRDEACGGGGGGPGGGGGGGDPEVCDDGIDNDGDGKTDCADKKDCGKDPAC